jgi:hypothetical protein
MVWWRADTQESVSATVRRHHTFLNVYFSPSLPESLILSSQLCGLYVPPLLLLCYSNLLRGYFQFSLAFAIFFFFNYFPLFIRLQIRFELFLVAAVDIQFIRFPSFLFIFFFFKIYLAWIVFLPRSRILVFVLRYYCDSVKVITNKQTPQGKTKFGPNFKTKKKPPDPAVSSSCFL